MKKEKAMPEKEIREEKKEILCVCAGTFHVDSIMWANKKIEELKAAGMEGFHLVRSESQEYLYVGKLANDADEATEIILEGQEKGFDLSVFNM